MDPIDKEWLGIRQEPVEEMQPVPNFIQSYQWREMGLQQPHFASNKSVFENMAEDTLVQKELKFKSVSLQSCDLPGFPRSTFLMVFSPDGTKVASTHGNHNVYVSELSSGKHVKILKGHPRTPWCIAFHPSHQQIIGSGCLGGQVRVWDLSGGSEVWTVPNETAIASIAFHPRAQILVVATCNELYFWDWRLSAPFSKVCTSNFNEKVRYVAFDPLGYKLITGISLWINTTGVSSVSQNNNTGNSQNSSPGSSRTSENRSEGSSEDSIVNSYQNLVQRCDNLVRNYQRLFLARHRLNHPATTPMTDRGTDPMETEGSSSQNQESRSNQSTASTSRQDSQNENSSHQFEGLDNGDGDASGSRLLNLDVLSINGEPSRELNVDQNGNESQPSDPITNPQRLRDEAERHLHSIDSSQRARLLPNPFSYSRDSGYYTAEYMNNVQEPQQDNPGSSRTSVFTTHRRFAQGARHFQLNRRNSILINASTPEATETSASRGSTPRASTDRPRSHASTSTNNDTLDEEQNIHRVLATIRNILRESGTRLLRIMANASLSRTFERTLRQSMQLHSDIDQHSQDAMERSDEAVEPGDEPRSIFNDSLPRDILTSESDSDSDILPPFNMFRARSASQDVQARILTPPQRTQRPTSRLVVELDSDEDAAASDAGRINISLASNRFCVRSHSTDDNQPSEPRTGSEPEPSGSAPADPSDPSTSRGDVGWAINPYSLSFRRASTEPTNPIDENVRRVRQGINAFNKHQSLLLHMLARGSPVPLRDLRIAWENLRRRLQTIYRQTGRQDTPLMQTRVLMERFRTLSEATRINVGHSGRSRPAAGNQSVENESTAPSDMERNTPSTSGSSARPRLTGRRRSSESRSNDLRSIVRLLETSSPVRRAAGAGGAAGERGRRSRAPGSTRWALRPRARATPPARPTELQLTRSEIRTRCMQALSIMLTLMNDCIADRDLSHFINKMLTTLKTSLITTTMILLMNSMNSRPPFPNVNSDAPADGERATDPPPDDASGSAPAENDDNVQEPEPNVDRIELDANSVASNRSSESDDEDMSAASMDNAANAQPSTGKTNPPPSMLLSRPPSHRWSNRLAVQISAVNRNHTANARSRRDQYIEYKRQQALHRTNPLVHPITRRKVLPPVATYRIPNILGLQVKRKTKEKSTQIQPVAGPSNADPVPSTSQADRLRNLVNGRHAGASGQAGPSHADDEPSTSYRTRDSFMYTTANDFERRINLVRIARMHAVRLRSEARSRFRRLQTIRLYSPSAVREMLGFAANNNENQGSSNQGENNAELGSRRTFSPLRPHILMARHELLNDRERSNQYDYILNNVSVPVANDAPANEPRGSSPPARLYRIHGYGTPIIAHVEEAPGGDGLGLAGLVDAGLVSEVLPMSTHRVQAWDFTNGETPDIADTSKNVVVQRCRIHNDASIDISKDGKLLVALLPVPQLRHANHCLGVFSLEWGRLGQRLHTAVLEQTAVSVALSPTSRYLAVGVGTRRFTTLPHARNNVYALLYRLSTHESATRTTAAGTTLVPIRELEQNWEQGFTSLNCLRWAPQPGQGLVYANNTGQLIVLS